MRLILTTLFAFAFLGAAAADDKKITFQDHVLPLLREKCAACHNADKKQAGLNVTNYTALMEGGGRGKAIEPGDPEQSTLYLLMAHKETPHMPPKSPKLPDKDLELVAGWIKGGALETTGSTSQVKKSKVDLGLKTVARGKPAGPPPMPGVPLRLDPIIKTPRGSAIIALATSPWAPLAAVGGERSVLLYHTDTQELLGVLPFPEGQVNVLRFSRNGSLLLAGGGRGGQSGKIVIWDVKTGSRLAEVGDEQDAVLAADISPDQTQVALGGSNKVVRIYSIKDNSVLFTLKKHTDWVTALEYSPDGVLLATGDRNGGITVWETPTGQEYLSPRGPQAAITELSWRPDGNVLAAASEDTQVRLFEMENGNLVKGWGAHAGGAESVRYHHDGRLVSTGRDRVAKIWDGNGALQKQLPAASDIALRAGWTFDGKKVLVGDWTGHITFFTTSDAKQAGLVASNPPKVEERLSGAVQKLEAARAKHTQLTSQMTALQANVTAATTALAAAQKQAQDAGNAIKAATDAAAKAAADPLLAPLHAATAALPARELAVARLAEAAGKAKEAAEKLKEPELQSYAVLSQALATKHLAELTAARQYIAQLATAAKPAQEKLSAANAEVVKAQAAVNALSQQVPPRQAALKAAQDQLAPVLAATKAAESDLQHLQATIERLQKAIQASKAAATASK